MATITEQLIKARRFGTPIIAINSADAESTISTIISQADFCEPLYAWDSLSGIQPMNKTSGEMLKKVGISQEDIDKTIDATEAFLLMQRLPSDQHTGTRGSIIFFPNAHMYYADDKGGYRDVRQGIQKLRSMYESTLRTLVMLAPEHHLPADIVNSVLLLDEPLPNEAELETVVNEITAAAGVTLTKDQVTASTFAVRGLTAYKARESISLSFTTTDKAITGIDIKELWQRKEMIINQTDGLKYHKSDVTFDDLGGLDALKKFIARLFDGNQSPQAVLFIDELEKSMGGADGDTSGVSQDQLGVLLQSMEDYNWTGLIAVGFPGGGKTAIANSVGNYKNIPTIRLDLGAMMGSLVGESQQKIRAAIKVIHAIAGDRVFCIGTSNDVSRLKPELIRRFTFGRWFFDLPSAEQRAKIWDIYQKKYNLTDGAFLPDDTGWTGAEIKVCSSLAYRMNISLMEASEYIVPFHQSNGELVSSLRQQATGRYLDANNEGFYKPPSDFVPSDVVIDYATPKRKFVK